MLHFMDDKSDTTDAGDGIDLGPLGNSLGFLLRLSQLQVFREYFRELDGLDLRPGELSVLMLIARNPGIRQGVLARGLMIKRAHMTKMVQGFQQAGLLRRTVPESDRRSVELWLTEAGQARLDNALTPFHAHETRAEGALNQEEIAEMKRLLRRFLGLDPGAASGG